MSQKNIAIIGGGLVGSLLACFLGKRGHLVNVYERRSDMRKAGYVGGKSINLALSDRGWRALEQVGLAKEVHAIATPMTGRCIHQVDGSVAYQPYGKEGQAIYSVSRGLLNEMMVNAAEKYANVKFHFDERLAKTNLETSELTLENTQTLKQQTLSFDYVFGADGAFSALREDLLKSPNFNYSQTFEEYAYKELTIPAGENNTFLIEKNALHIWPKKSFMMIALPNIDGSYTVTLFAPFKGENGFDLVKTEQEMDAYFQHNFPSAIPLMPTLKTDFFQNPTSSLVTVRCFPWVYKNLCLIGDAAHAVVPFYGQGMNCGFEDVRVLDHILEKETNWDKALDEYQHARKPNADAIANLALYNFVEMRDLSAQEDFQLRLKIEKNIAAHYPEKFSTLYWMVTFSHTPYAEAMQKSKKQCQLIDQIMRLDNIKDNWDSPEVLLLAKNWIEKEL